MDKEDLVCARARAHTHADTDTTQPLKRINFREKKNKIFPFAATQMALEGIVPGDMSEKDKYCMLSLLCGILKIPQTREYEFKKADSQTTN